MFFEVSGRTNWHIFGQNVCFRGWLSLHGVGNSRMSRILKAMDEGKAGPYEDRRHTPDAKEKVQQNLCGKLAETTDGTCAKPCSPVYLCPQRPADRVR
jgi:hypothetical protein